MVAFIVAAWYCYVRAQTQPLWGAARGRCALLAFFTKAAAAFLRRRARRSTQCCSSCWPCRGSRQPRPAANSDCDARAAWASCGARRARAVRRPALDGLPFYNWQMSVTRKPSYDVASLLDRVTWFPIVHDIFTRHVVHGRRRHGCRSRVRSRAGARLPPPERLLRLWVGLGAFELLVARRRQRAPVHVLHSGARRAGGNRPGPRAAARCRQRSLNVGRAIGARGGCRSSSTPRIS